MKDLKRSWHRRSLKAQEYSGGKTRRRRPTTSRPVWLATAAVWPVLPVWPVVGPVWPVRPVNLGTAPRSRQGRVFRNSWPNMRRKGVLRDRRGDQAKSRIRYHRQNIKSNRVKVIVLHLVDRLLHRIAGILTFIHLWIIVGCICNHIIFNILIYISKSCITIKIDFC